MKYKDLRQLRTLINLNPANLTYDQLRSLDRYLSSYQTEIKSQIQNRLHSFTNPSLQLLYMPGATNVNG